MSEIVVHIEKDYHHCLKCCLKLDEYVEFADGHCPRCAYDLTIIDTNELPATDDQLKKRQGEKELYDLLQMVRNWAKFHSKYITEHGIDWSAPHELIEMIGQQMMPWIGRLVQTGYFGKDEVAKIGAQVDYEVTQLIGQLEAEEDILRLTGQWSDSEQETKDYWQKKMGIIRQLPMRNVERISSDK